MAGNPKNGKDADKIVDVLHNKNNEVVGDGFIEVDADKPAHRPNPDNMKTQNTIVDGGNIEDTDGPFTNADDPVLRENITNPDISKDDE